MSQITKERILNREVAAGRLKAEEAVKLLNTKGGLNESAQSFKGGQTVYVAHGIHAGSQGKFIKEANGGYAEVDLGTAGKTQYVPVIFLLDRLNK